MIVGYGDAAWAVRLDGTSQGGFMIFVVERSYMLCDRRLSVSHTSEELEARSSLSAESQALSDTIDEIQACLSSRTVR
jgi:hypothetical protein